MPERLLTIEDVARQLSLTPYTVRRWARERRIPMFKPPRAKRYIIRESEFTAWLETSAQAA